MSKEMTSVEWLWEQIDNTLPYQNIKTSQVFNGLLEKAKELHRQQIIDAYTAGSPEFKDMAEEFYYETYGNV